MKVILMDIKINANVKCEYVEKIKSLQNSISNINKALSKIKEPNNQVLNIELKEFNINYELLGINEDFFFADF